MIAEYRLIWVGPTVAPRFPDPRNSRPFSSFDSAKGDVMTAVLLDGWCTRAVIGWTTFLAYCCGFEFVYGPSHQVMIDSYIVLPRDVIVSSAAHSFTSPIQPTHSIFHLLPDESIVRVRMVCTQIIHQIRFVTNRGRERTIGDAAYSETTMIHAPPNSALIGVVGLRGDCILTPVCASTISRRKEGAC